MDLSVYFPRLALDWARETPDLLWTELDASLVFVDISGFTALSERLARRGHQGAEELTQTLSTCFADLLVAAYADGGSLMKFGGDALFLLFTGDGHAPRAAHAVLQMRARLGKTGRITTSVGNIGLRMSAGVHSGPVHLFRVGESHRELLIAGPGPSSVVLMEQTASAGQIVISPGTAARIDGKLVGEHAGPGYFLRTRPRISDDVSFPSSRPVTADLAGAVPVALRDHLATSIEPEHRQVTVAFIRFDGIDDVIAADGPEAAALALDELVTDVQRAVDHEGVTFLGTDADRDGGKIIVVGGAPSTLDDTEGRVLRAMRQVIEKPRRLPVRIGVNQGHAFVGEVGPSYRRTYTVMGDTVNLAARLMASAAAGEVRATAGVLDLAGTQFETVELEPFFVKGKSRPVEAFLVGERLRRRARAVTDLQFVGREDERWQLTAALDAMRSGNGGLVDIAGEPGIGKSRLLRELLAEAPDLPTVTAYCETYEAKTPYFAARFLLRGALGMKDLTAGAPDVLRAVVTESAPELLPWLPLVGGVIGVEVPPTAESSSLNPQFLREQTARVIVDLLDAVVPGQQLFVVEDAQWLDDLSAEILVAVAKKAQTRRWLVVVVRRLERDGYQPGDEASTKVFLDILSDDEARALLDSALGEDALLRPDQVAELVDRAGGNPLFIEQLARAAAGAHDTSDLGSLESVIAAQIDKLPNPERRALRYAAVLGPMFEAARLEELVAADGGNGRAATRRLRAFLEPAGPGWLRFRNQCYREVAYETLSFRKRKDLHAEAGAAIETAMGDQSYDRAEILSYHFHYAQDYEKCWDYALVAAERARDKYANVEATALYERALDAGTQLPVGTTPPLARVFRSLGEAAFKASLYELAKSSFKKARKLAAGDTRLLAELCHLDAKVEMHQGRMPSSTRWINRGLRLVESSETSELIAARANMRTTRAEQLRRSRNSARARTMAELAEADARACADRAALASAIVVAEMALVDVGRLGEAVRLQDALDIWVELNNLNEQGTVLMLLGAIAYWKGDWDATADYFLRSRDAYIGSGDLVTAGYCTSNLAEVLLDQGRGDEMPGMFELIHLWRSVGHPNPVPGALVNVGRAALQRGDVMKARDMFDQARWAAEDMGAETLDYDYWVAECLIREGEAQDALTLVDHALKAIAHEGSMYAPRFHRARGFALLALERREDAAHSFGRAVEAARALGLPYEVALAIDGLARVEPSDAATAERDATFAKLGVRATFPPLVERVADDDDGFAS